MSLFSAFDNKKVLIKSRVDQTTGIIEKETNGSEWTAGLIKFILSSKLLMSLFVASESDRTSPQTILMEIKVNETWTLGISFAIFTLAVVLLMYY